MPAYNLILLRIWFLLVILLWYIDGKLSEEKRDELSSLIIEHLPKDDGEKLMKTIADCYIEEGINKGVAIGEARGVGKGVAIALEKTARRMLQKNTNIKFVSSVTGLSSDKILKIQNKM